MKKIFLILGLLILSINTNAQTNKFYVGISGGYGFATGQGLNFNSDLKRNTNIKDFFNLENGNYSSVNLSILNGINGKFIIGYKLNKKINIEIDFAYMNSKTVKTSKDFSSGENEAFNNNLSSKIFYIEPGFVFNIDTGLFVSSIDIKVILANSIINYNSNIITPSYTDSLNLDIEYEFSGGIDLGLKFGYALTINVCKQLSIKTQISYSNIWLSPKNIILKRYFINNKDYSNDLWDGIKNKEFVSNYSNSEKNNYFLKQYFPASSISFNIGVIFNF